MLARLAVVALAVLWVTALSEAPEGLPQGEVLYNGIRLPTPWPPRVAELTAEPMPVPYLTSPPAVIPIDVGRQLFVDDFLVESTTLQRAFHSAEYCKGNPVLRPDKPWEQTGRDPCAMVFSDGVWYDPQDSLLKMWYMGGYVASTCYATSRDGVHWEKPALDVKPGTNVVMEGWRDSSTVWLDLDEKAPAKRYKMFRVGEDAGWRVLVYFSADGIHWGKPVGRSAPTGDRTTVFWNPFRKVWVYGLRADSRLGRSRQYFESPDALAGANWKPGEPVWWTAADRLDRPRDDLKTRPQLYNLDAVAYESLMVGIFTIWRGQPADRPKPNEVLIGFSRDGFHWDRTNRRPFIPVSENKGDWNWGNVQSCGGGCLVVGDRLFFYVSGRRGVPGTSSSGECATGLAMLRRDGFASMDVAGSAGTLTTRPVRFTGKHLFVNVDAGDGELRAEALDESGRAAEPFTAANCQAVRGDTTRAAVRWTGAEDLAPLAGKPVRFRFHLTAGRLYSFWVSSDKAGASRGYVAAGGPGFTASTDTVGEAAGPARRLPSNRGGVGRGRTSARLGEGGDRPSHPENLRQPLRRRGSLGRPEGPRLREAVLRVLGRGRHLPRAGPGSRSSVASASSRCCRAGPRPTCGGTCGTSRRPWAAVAGTSAPRATPSRQARRPRTSSRWSRRASRERWPRSRTTKPEAASPRHEICPDGIPRRPARAYFRSSSSFTSAPLRSPM